jgi:hypothetical protein
MSRTRLTEDRSKRSITPLRGSESCREDDVIPSRGSNPGSSRPRPPRATAGLGAAEAPAAAAHTHRYQAVNLSRLQASLDVAARALAPSVEALDTPLGPHEFPLAPGVCYSALRRLPRRDLHPLERCSKKQNSQRSIAPLRHDAPCGDSKPKQRRALPLCTRKFRVMKSKDRVRRRE